ncbi:hypothetical protein HYC85_003673 [Camellia sinensis]|uniref:Protein kinase domain-containing protein n=1 Tax=Camellia sinensis TaxID=4442 RepID=A0A7J7HWZ6_CAMSI|nr:hypothetical protein HYC85_003673 [Camellia sinensis]
MTVKKITWRSLILSCYMTENPSPKPTKKAIVSKQSSFQRISMTDLSSSTLSEDLSVSLAGSNLYVFTVAELRVITQNFSQSNFLGEGGFGPVHKGFIDDKLRPGLKAQPVAVKLLDLDGTQGLHCKTLRFWACKDGPEGDDTHVSTRVMGTQGYAAPEYIMTGHLTAASDVYSFGVVLLELLTGRRSVDKTRPHREQSLAEWARPQLKCPRKLGRIMDPRLEGQYSETGAQKAAQLAYECLSHRPKLRPTMSSVVKTLETLKDYVDIPMVTFVYTAPSESDSNKESVKECDSPPKELKRENGNQNYGNRHHGHRHHRTKSPKSQSVYSETALNQNIKNGLNSPKRA